MDNDKNLTLKQIKELIDASPVEKYASIQKMLSGDTRESAQKMLLKLNKRIDEHRLEELRLDNIKSRELALYEKGYQNVCGIDEVGRGPLCGPVVSAAVIMPKESRIYGVNDSKKLSAPKREQLYDAIINEAVSIGIGVVDNHTIDKINILNATKLSMKKAVRALSVKPDYILIDALNLDINIPNEGIKKADENIYCVMAASIVAKVLRDKLMTEYANQYPEYALDSNKGYGSAKHFEAIKKYGSTDIHRMSFISSVTESSYSKGKRYEREAAEYLKSKGYEIIQLNYKCREGEIDIIAKQGDTVVFAEVKSRSTSSFGSAEEAINLKKQQRIILASQKYIVENDMHCRCRYDAVAIEIKGGRASKINHIADAFDLSYPQDNR